MQDLTKFDERGAALFLSRAALIHNYQTIMAHTGAQKMIAVVKADAYGLGAAFVAKTLFDQGVRDFAVATTAEGIALRQALGDRPAQIILLGVQNPALALQMQTYELAPAVGDVAWLTQAAQVLAESGQPDRPVRVHLAVDTGMGRMGVQSTEEMAAVYQLIQSNSAFELAGVFTHFATADEHDQAYYDLQKERFLNLVQSQAIDPAYWHLANSGSALFHPAEINCQTLRVGSALYGYNPAFPEKDLPVALEPVATWQAQVWACHRLAAGRALSYGATYVATEDQWVGTVPIGYADGYHRNLVGMTVLVQGTRQRILGRITMDQVVISLPGPVPFGTPVTLIGQDGQASITVEDLAAHSQTIPHEILTGIGARIPRIAIEERR
ncbi:alanine racemase [Leuconostocaceae bacterium ESL0958]|nr:alanine racemase [Leuconostocaceae bacterium ESL0958]